MDFRELLNTSEYDFLRTDPRLGKRIMLLGLSGSYGYGTNREGSDIDFRGVTLNLPSDILGLTTFEQFEDRKTDTVIYGFNKLIGLLLNCNPNTIEILGLYDDQYLIKSPLGQELLDHKQTGGGLLRTLCRCAAPTDPERDRPGYPAAADQGRAHPSVRTAYPG